MYILVVAKSKLLGVQNQSVGIARVIGHQFSKADIELIYIEARWWARGLVVFLNSLNVFRVVGPAGKYKWLWKCLFKASKEIEDQPSYIVSKFKKTEYASVALSNFFNVPNIHCGSPKYFDSTRFSMLVNGNDKYANNIKTDIIPSKYNRFDLSQFDKTEQTEQPGKTKWFMVVGGDCDACTFQNREWHKLVEFMKRAAEEHDILWSLSTSPRTGKRVEEILHKNLQEFSWIEKTVFWSNDKSSLLEMIAQSELCFVTDESMSMISDCLALGKKTISIIPEDRNNKYSRIEVFTERLSEERKIMRLGFNDLETTEVIESIDEFSSNSANVAHWDKEIVQKMNELGILS